MNKVYLKIYVPQLDKLFTIRKGQLVDFYKSLPENIKSLIIISEFLDEGIKTDAMPN